MKDNTLTNAISCKECGLPLIETYGFSKERNFFDPDLSTGECRNNQCSQYRVQLTLRGLSVLYPEYKGLVDLVAELDVYKDLMNRRLKNK